MVNPAVEEPRAEPASQPDANSARRKRKKGTKKPAGSRWLNYLLALGCAIHFTSLPKRAPSPSALLALQRVTPARSEAKAPFFAVAEGSASLPRRARNLEERKRCFDALRRAEIGEMASPASLLSEDAVAFLRARGLSSDGAASASAGVFSFLFFSFLLFFSLCVVARAPRLDARLRA